MVHHRCGNESRDFRKKEVFFSDFLFLILFKWRSEEWCFHNSLDQMKQFEQIMFWFPRFFWPLVESLVFFWHSMSPLFLASPGLSPLWFFRVPYSLRPLAWVPSKIKNPLNWNRAKILSFICWKAYIWKEKKVSPRGTRTPMPGSGVRCLIH